jgi:hypothetical protein
LALRADFAVNCVRFQLLDENIRRSKSCIGNVFPARDETVSVPENPNDSSHDDQIRPLGLRCLKRMVRFGRASSARIKILAPLKLQLQQHIAARHRPKYIAIQEPRRTAFEIQSQSRLNPL